MAFQPSGPCSSSPYKCLHVISSELYKSILNNNAKGDGNTDSSSNSSAYSAPNIQNNFYPSNNQFFDNPDNDNKKPPSYFKTLLDVLKILCDFFYGPVIPRDETLTRMRLLLQLYASDTSELVSRYFDYNSGHGNKNSLNICFMKLSTSRSCVI